ncbi:MAG: hypothetical protein GF408_00025 [Candidatus Omnitrophica bacterium]|nr:hypothetical protein [Candidatus Omnitrophota bacterium]
MPFLTYLPFAFLNFVLKGRRFVPREYLIATLLASVYILMRLLFTLAGGEIEVGLKDYFYCAIPWIFLVLLGGLRTSDDNYWLLKAYFYLNLAVAFFSKVPLDITRRIIHAYYAFGMGNIVSGHKYLDYLTYRPGGMLIHAPWFGFMMYLLGRVFFMREKKKYYLALSLAAIIISGAKGALLSFIIIEGFLFLRIHRSWLIRSGKAILAGLLLFLLLAVIYRISPYFHEVMDIIFLDYITGGEWGFYSIAYRLEMYSWAFRDIAGFILGGTISVAHLSEIGRTYIDSEFVMRSLQFGFIGYLLFLANYAVFFYRASRSGSAEISEAGRFLLLFVFLGTLSTTIATNMVFVLFLVIIVDLYERDMAFSRFSPESLVKE